MAAKEFLRGKRIAISISESEQLNKLGYSDIHLKDAMIEFARHLLIQGATLVYGGDLRNGGYTEIFADLAEEYRLKEIDTFHFENYFSYPIHLSLNKEHLGNFKAKRVKVVKVNPDESLAIEKQVYVEPDTPENKYIWAKCLTKMRHEMNHAVDARIVLGGRNYGYLGKYPGIMEETHIAIESGKPTYLIGTFGGATLRMIKAITEQKPIIDLSATFYQNTDYQAFKDNYNAQSRNELINVNELNNYFSRLSTSKLNNGLNDKDNQRLFTTSHVPEAVYFILKGLKVIID